MRPRCAVGGDIYNTTATKDPWKDIDRFDRQTKTMDGCLALFTYKKDTIRDLARVDVMGYDKVKDKLEDDYDKCYVDLNVVRCICKDTHDCNLDMGAEEGQQTDGEAGRNVRTEYRNPYLSCSEI